MLDSRPFWFTALGLWMMLILTEAANGTFRRIVLDPRIGDVHGRQIAVGTGSALMMIVMWNVLDRLGRQRPARWWALGVFWIGLTLAFELGVGRLTGASWARLASDFDPRLGGLLGFGMLLMAVAPRLIAGARRLVLR
jgi:hypothetical protein